MAEGLRLRRFERVADRDRPAPAGSVPVVSPYRAQSGLGRPRWWERLRSAVGLGGLVLLGGVVAAGMVAGLLLAAAIFIATAFG